MRQTITDDAPLIEQTSIGGWRSAVQGALHDRWRFGGLWAAPAARGLELRAAFTRDSEILLLRCPSQAGRFQSIVDLVPAAEWDEREAHDL